VDRTEKLCECLQQIFHFGSTFQENSKFLTRDFAVQPAETGTLPQALEGGLGRTSVHKVLAAAALPQARPARRQQVSGTLESNLGASAWENTQGRSAELGALVLVRRQADSSVCKLLWEQGTIFRLF
jgi:hypothetical protein